MRLRPKPSAPAGQGGSLETGNFASQAAYATLEVIGSSISIDRSLAPPAGKPQVQLPACLQDCSHRPGRAAAQVEGVTMTFCDLIPDNVLSAMPAAERAIFALPTTDQRARRHIDVADGPVVTVDPGFEDLARIRCPSALAFTLYLLGPREGCACYAALVAAVPADEPIGIFARAKATSLTAAQIADGRTAAIRRNQASAELSAHFRTLSEQRRRPVVGDLFAAFDIDSST